MLVYVEGNIGSGKSTFVDLLEKNVKSIKEKKLALITEPVDEWLNLKDHDGRNILEHFYEDQEKWSFAFQMNSFISRIHRIEQEKADINIVERSVFTDKYCFAKNCYESGKMTKIEYDTYCRWNDWLVNHFNVIPNGSISDLGNSGNVSACHKYDCAFLPALEYLFLKKASEPVRCTSIIVLIDSFIILLISDSKIILCLVAFLIKGVTVKDKKV